MTDLNFSNRFPRTLAVINEGIERQFHSGCQIYVSVNRQPQADCGIGESSPGRRMTADTINLWLSAGKPLTAVVIAELWQQGKLELDDPVFQFIPEFATGGKDRITIRHLLTHTGGFRNINSNWAEAGWSQLISEICASPVEADWVIGRTAGYHTVTSWFILGEIIQRLTGRAYADVMRQDLFEPLGMTETWSAINATQYAEFGDRIGQIFAREKGELQPLNWHTPERCAIASPGSNTRGPIRDLGRFYEMMLNRGVAANRQVLTSQTVDSIAARHRVGQFDLTLAHQVDFGLGVLIDSNQYGADTVPYGYGRYCSPRTYGHGGAQSSQGYCDPEQGLVVAYYFNGRPGEGQNSRRTRQLNDAIYQDLNIA